MKVDSSNGEKPLSKVPLFEDLPSLRQELQEILEMDNLQYRSEQEAESLRKRSTRASSDASMSGPIYKRNDDDDNPPSSSGGSCGDGSGFTIASREVF